MYFNILLQEAFTFDFHFRDLFIVVPEKLKSSTTSISTPFILIVRASMRFGGTQKNIILGLFSFINNLFTSIQVLILVSSSVIMSSVDSLDSLDKKSSTEPMSVVSSAYNCTVE